MRYRTRISFVLFLFCFLTLFQVKRVPVCGQTLNHWAEEQVVEWLDRKLLQNADSGILAYDEYLTRAEFVTMINRTFGFQAKASLAFKDISPSAWYAGEFAKAVKAGYLQGYADGTMKPDNLISRQEAAVILAKLFHLTLVPENNLAGYKDVDSIPKWSRSFLNAMVTEGYLSGYQDRTIRPDRFITKAETTVLLAKVAGKLINEPGSFGSELEKTIIPGNVTICAPGVILNNLEINGNLYIFQGESQEPVVLNNVNVKGRTLLRGDGQLQLRVEGDSQLNLILLGSALRVQGDQNGLSQLTIREAPRASLLQFNGNFHKLSLEAAEIVLSLAGGTVNHFELAKTAYGTVVNLSRNARIELLSALAAARITGYGVISETASRVNGVTVSNSIRQGDQTISISPGKKVKDNNSSPSPSVRVEEIILTPNNLLLESGQLAQLTASVKPVNATNKNLRWISSDPNVAIVDQQGKVTALNPGTATVTVVTEDGSKTASCIIEVREALDQLAELLNRINNTENLLDLKGLLETNASVLGLDLEDYVKLDESIKLLVLQALYVNKPSSGYTRESLNIVFQEIVGMEKTIIIFLSTVNNAQEVTDLQGLSWLDMLLDDLLELNYYTKREDKDITVLRKDLASTKQKLNALKVNQQQAVLQQLIHGKPFGGYGDPFEVCEKLNLALTEVLKELSVTNQAELLQALSFSEVQTIKLNADLLLDQPILIKRPVRILGNNHTLTLQKALEGNQESYVFKICDSDGVYIKDLKFTGGKGAILLSGSQVTLTGLIVLSGNEYGGIKLERSGKNASNLDITQAELIKSDESYGLPVILMDEQEAGGIVGGQFKKLLVRDEIHYYSSFVLSPVTTIKVKADNDIVLAIDNEKNTLVRASGYKTVKDIKSVIESTDWSKQKYTFWPEEGSKPLADDISPGNRSKLVVTAEDGTEKTYTIYVGKI